MTHSVTKNMYRTIYDNLNMNPCFDYYLFDDIDCAKFIKENFDSKVLCAFNNLVPGAYKADLWRYCVIYKFGGVYLDIKFKVKLDLKSYIEKYDQMLVTDKPGDKNEDDIYQGIIILNKNHSFLMDAINKVVENVKNNFYGNGSLHPTGPKLFGEIIKRANLQSLRKTILQTIKHPVPANKDLHLVCNTNPPVVPNIQLIANDIIIDNTNRIPVICRPDSTLLFSAYETYRADQDAAFMFTKTKHYGQAFPEGQPFEFNKSAIPKNIKTGEYDIGIYKTNKC
jgi:hypothetical protein